jgi:hypothetical protein
MSTASLGTVLLDAPSPTDVTFDVAFLERNDHPVIVCRGPAVGQLCPLLAEDRCAKYDAAHGVVFELDLDRPQHQAILQRYRARNPDIPIRVVVPSDQAGRFPDLLADVQVWEREPTVADLDGFAAEIEAADRYPSPTQT